MMRSMLKTILVFFMILSLALANQRPAQAGNPAAIYCITGPVQAAFCGAVVVTAALWVYFSDSSEDVYKIPIQGIPTNSATPGDSGSDSTDSGNLTNLFSPRNLPSTSSMNWQGSDLPKPVMASICVYMGADYLQGGGTTSSYSGPSAADSFGFCSDVFSKISNIVKKIKSGEKSPETEFIEYEDFDVDCIALEAAIKGLIEYWIENASPEARYPTPQGNSQEYKYAFAWKELKETFLIGMGHLPPIDPLLLMNQHGRLTPGPDSLPPLPLENFDVSMCKILQECIDKGGAARYPNIYTLFLAVCQRPNQ